MKTNYIVLFDDRVETYCSTINAVKETIEEMVEQYVCNGLSEKTLRKDIEVYKVSRMKV